MAGRVHEWNLGDRLRAAREEAGYGQREFAARTGISRGSISSYENGTTTPRRPAILAWAEATGFDPGWLESGKSQWGASMRGRSRAPDGSGRRTERVLRSRWGPRGPASNRPLGVG